MSQSASAAPIALPTGGGALSGIGEKFKPDLHTGTGNFTIPIAVPGGRSGVQPDLQLLYSSGQGNGPFGLGWAMPVAGVSRKTSHGIPRYDDQQDVFILSGAEDLVAIAAAGPRTRYRPRTESLFARIERHLDATNDYWEVASTSGSISVYGTKGARGNDPAVVADPEARERVFAWRLTATEDPCGNRIEYEYLRDSGNDGPHHWDQLYLSRVRYVDHGTDRAHPKFLVTIDLAYAPRPDPFSDHRGGFEIRTRQRCTRLNIGIDADAALRVRSYDFVYVDERPELAEQPPNGVSLLSQVRMTGHDGAVSEPFPPLEFGYTHFDPKRRDFFPVEGEALPATSLADPNLAMVDLFGSGLPDFLQMDGAVRYWRNLGSGRFDLPRFMADAPGGLALMDPGVQLVDTDGDGRTDLMVTSGAVSGYFSLTTDGRWDARSFRRFDRAPSFSLADADVRLLDLDGDGVTDALRAGARFECFFNSSLTGWSSTRTIERQALEHFPNVSFTDPRVHIADFTGDGLQDIVLVGDGSIVYWPNRGYGRWGDRVPMRRSPKLPYGHDPRRVLIADVDGDGLADLVYVEDRKVTLWINQSGNGWSEPITIQGTPPVTDADAVRIVDLLGTGVSGVLWTRNADGISRERLYFLDFTGSVKPYLLRVMDNHIGATTTVQYAPSTRFYLEDQRQRANHWKTTMPFPVQVVTRVEVSDAFTPSAITSEYRYHHGHWDGAEREFRGFGIVEQFDTEVFGQGSTDRRLHTPPTLTRTWFHQGPVGEEHGDWQELDWSDQFFRDDPPLLGHTEGVNRFLRAIAQSPDSRRIKRDALRALRGSVLRTELYALDGSPMEDRPYSVSETAYGMAEIDAPADASDQRRRIFFAHVTAQRTTHWERGNDPMTSFAFSRYRRRDGDPLDPFGRPIAQINVACPRGWRSMADRPGAAYLSTFTVTAYAAPAGSLAYIHTRAASVTMFEINGTAGKTVADLATLDDTGPGLKVIGHSRHFYDGPAFLGLPLGQLGDHGLLARTESLALADDLIQAAYGAQTPPYLVASGSPAWTADYPTEFRTALATRAGYSFHAGSASPLDPGGYYVTSERRRYDVHSDPNGRGLLLEALGALHDAAVDPTAHRVLYTYDRFALLPVRATDAAGLAIAATYDYRVLRPLEVIDANGNATRFKYSPQGLLTASWVRGKTATDGDQLRPSLEFEYALLAFDQSPPQHRQPIFARTIRRVHHDSKLTVPLPERDATITTVEYTDGFGRLLQLRRQDDDDRFGDSGFGGGSTLLPPDQDDDASAIVVGQTNASAAAPDVVVNGWTIYDNKGQVVEQYEPFFSEGWAYGQPADAQLGQKVRMFYDPRGHIVRTVMPDGAEELVVQGVPGRIAVPDLERPDAYEPTPWKLYSYDANDNAGRTHQAESATWRHHWNTPSSVVLDALGRTVETIQRNRNAPAVPGGPRPPMEELRTRTTHDIRGNVLAVTDARNRIAIRNVFDLANRAMRTASIDAGERSIVLDAGNNAVETRSGTGALVLSASDRIDRTIRIWARDGAGQPTTLRERHEYGDGGQANQPAAERNAARANNQLGRLARVCDEAGQLLFAAYDFKGNLLEKTRRPIADAAVLAAFDGSPPGWNVTAHRVDWQNIAAVPLGPVSYTSNLGYDALNRATRVTYPEDVDHSRRSSLPVYGRSGALRSVTLAADRHVERIARNAKGQRVLVVYGNGVMTRYAHDPRTMRLLRLRTERFTTTSNLSYRPAGEVLQDVAYDYDLAGNLLAMHDRTPGSGISGPPAGEDALDRIFGYDALYRLNSATGRECDTPPDLPWDSAPRCVDRTKVRAWTEQYTFDSTGSLTRLRHAMGADARISEFTVAGSSNQLASLTQGSRVYAYAYDANGNLTQETTSRHLEWDHRDRLRVYRTQIPGSEPTVHAHYQYDWMGQRVRKIVRKGANRVETTTYIDGVFEHERIVTAGTVQENSTVHVMDDRARIAMARVGTAFAGDVLPALQYHLGDHLGSSAVVLDATGALINREEYLPFGTTSFGSYARKRYRFGGHERDGESDLGYAGARYYLPWAGRWASCDPAGPMDGLNLYAYVRNSPLVLNDPTGTEGENDYGGTSPPGGAATPDTTSQERPADHEASTPQPNEEPFGPPPPPPKAPTQEQLFAAQQRAAYEKSVAERNSWGQTGKSLMRSVIPATMTATSPAPRLQGMPPGMSQYSDPAAQGDISAAGGNVAKKTVEYGGTAATVVGDVGMAGAQVGFKTIGSIAAEEAVTTAPNLVARAAEIHSAIAPHMSLWAAERTTVAVTRAMIDGVSKTIVTVNNRKGYQLLQQGIGQVAQHELGQAPSRLNTWFRQIWNFKNLHAEELGIRTLKRMGATGGETATAPWRGCFRCQMMIDRLNGMFGESWKHLNPAADVVLRPFR